MRYAYIMILLLIGCVVGEQEKCFGGDCGTFPNGVYITGCDEQKNGCDSEKIQADYDPDKLFVNLTYNTDTCKYVDGKVDYCQADYTVKNNLAEEITLEKMWSMNYYDTKGQDAEKEITDTYYVGEDVEEIEYYDCWNPLSSMTEDCETVVVTTKYNPLTEKDVIKPEEAKKLRIVAEKTHDTNIEWIPKLTWTETDGADKIESLQGAYALWKKGPESAQTNLFAGYHLDEASGNAADFSGNGLTLTNFGTVTLNKPGVFATCANFTATTGQAFNTSDLKNFPRGGYGAGTAISFWIKPHSHATSDQQIIKLYNDTGNGQDTIYLSGGYLLADLNPCGTATANAKSLYVLNQWMHIVATTNGTHTLLYVNGTYIASNILGNCPNGTTNLWIGQAKDNTVRLNSTIDEVVFWSRNLNQTEITNLYEAGLTQAAFNTANMTWYPSNPGTIVNVTATIGFADKTIASNITYTNITGGIHQLRNNTGYEFNISNIVTWANNNTHNIVFANATTKKVGVFNATVKACGGNDLITCDTQQIFYGVEGTELLLPNTGTTTESPVNFKCNTYFKNTILNTTFHIYNDTAEYAQYSNTTPGNGTKSMSITLPNSDWNWTCQACTATTCIYAYNNNSLTTTVRATNPLDTLGACLTDRGYSFEYTAGDSDDYTQFNFTNMGTYMVDNNMSNIWVEYATEYHKANNHMLVDTQNEKKIIIWVGGYNYNFNHTTSAETPDKTVYLTIANFTLQNKAYWVDIRREDTNTRWNYTADSGTHTLDVLCDNYSPDTLDLVNLTSLHNKIFLLTVKEKPLFSGVLNGDFTRRYRSYLDTESVTLYFLNTTSTTYYNIDYELIDYLGTFGNSYFRIVRNINTTLSTVWQNTWYHLLNEDVSLENGTYYQYIVYTPTDTRIITWDRIVNGDKKYIVIREVKYTDKTDYLDGVSLGFTTSYDSSSVGASYNVSQGTLDSLTFTVYNYSTTNGYTQMYTTTVSGSNQGTITYTVPDNNKTYYLTASAVTSKYGTVKITELCNPAKTEQRFPMYDSFNLPATMFGVTRENLYTGASIFFITLIATATSSFSLGTGALVMMGAVGLLKYFNWFREMTWTLYAFLMAVAVAFAFVEGRRKTE